MDERELTAELVFARLEALRELLRLTDYLAGFRRAEPPPAQEEPQRDARGVSGMPDDRA